MQKDKEAHLLINRLHDLADSARRKNTPVHSQFLNLYEQTTFMSISRSFEEIRWDLFGGYPDAERKIVCFVSRSEEFSYDCLCCLCIEACNPKYAESLTHRDYLGALMNLGIERHMLGDILAKEHEAHIIALKQVEPVILSELTKVRNTKVRVCSGSMDELKSIREIKPISVNMASRRLDVAIAAVYHLSRKAVSDCVIGEKVFVNAKMTTNHSYLLKDDDLVSVRGLGRFRLLGDEHLTRKGRLSVKVDVFS